MLNNWLKIAFINYKKNWVSTLINLLGLTMGLTGFILVMLHWNDEKSYEDWNPNAPNTYVIENGVGGDVWTLTPLPQLYTAEENIPEIDKITFVDAFSKKVKISQGNKYAFAEIKTVGENFLDIFPFKIVAGDKTNAFVDDKSIFISEEIATELFGDAFYNKIGKPLDIDGNKAILKGVYQLPTSHTDMRPGILVRSSTIEDNNDWGNFNYMGFIQLKDGTNKDLVVAKLEKILFKHRVEIPAKEKGISVEEFIGDEVYDNKVYLTPLDKFHLDQKGQTFGVESNRGKKKSIFILFGLSVLILLLSAINFINLTTAQASQRAKEVGVRKALGTTKTQLILQFILETFILCLLALGLCFLLVELLLPTFNQFLGKDLSLNQPTVMLYSLIILIFLAMVSGLIPAIYLSNFKPINTLKGNFSRSKNGIWLRNGILMVQLIISALFVTSTIIVNQQVNYMMQKELGFDGDQSITIFFQGEYDEPQLKYEQFKRGLKQIKGVKDITYSQQVFGNHTMGSSTAHYKESDIQSEHGAIDINFIKFYDIDMVEGRDFDPKLASDTLTSTIVNQAFVREAGLKDNEMIGEKINYADTIDYTVIGVVEDFHIHNLNDKIEPIVLTNYNRNWMRNIQVKLDSQDIDGTLQRIETYWSKHAEPGYPFNYSFVNADFEKTFKSVQQQKTLFNILNGVVLLVALLGLFALSALMIEQKLKTVAIKKTLGASDKTLVFDLTKQFLIITTIAVLISIPLSYYFMNEWLQDFAYRIEMPWWPYVLSLVVLLALTFAVVSFKAYRATQVNLIQYLKYE
ncbi:MAG: ABC transporter permease [Weeksellaceae bacterium]